jgi:hypothetical protein
MAKKGKGRPPSKAMLRHQARHLATRLNATGKRLFAEAEAAGVEPETLAADATDLEAIKVFFDAAFEEYYKGLELQPAFKRSM